MQHHTYAAALVTLAIFALCGETGCSKNDDARPVTQSTTVYLDPHLHSARSKDFGTRGVDPRVSGTTQSLRAYANANGVEYIWLTDHAEDNPAPFRDSTTTKDGREICMPEFSCFNEVTLAGARYRLLVNPYIMPVSERGTIDGVELITTGGGDRPEEHRVGLEAAIALIQNGFRPAFLGSSNNHSGIAGVGGITLVYIDAGQSFAQALRNRQTSALKNRALRPVLLPNGRLDLNGTFDELQFYQVAIFSDHVDTTRIPGKSQQITFDPKAQGTFVLVYRDSELLAATSPVYSP